MTVKVEISQLNVVLQFLRDGLIISPDSWAALNSTREQDALDALRRLEARHQALLDEGGAIVEHDGIAELSPAQAAALGLPSAVDAVLSISQRGSLRALEIEYNWTRRDGRRLGNPIQCGAFLTIGTKQYRIPSPLFEIVRTIEAVHNAALDSDERLNLFNQLKLLLPSNPTKDLTASGMLLTMRFSYGEAFSLDATGTGSDLSLLPVLHRQPSEDEPDEERSEIPLLLPEHYQKVFAEQKFSASKNVQPIYALGEGTYVALSRPLRSALQVVREMQDQPPAMRREFLKNPRPWLKEKLGSEFDETVVESIFKESAAYSDRVIGLGLWQPRVLPWVKKPSSDWFGPQEYGIDVGGIRVPIKAGELPEVGKRIDDAIKNGVTAIRVPEPDGTMVPATPETREAIASLVLEIPAKPDAPFKPADPDKPASNVLIIEPNETAVGYSRNYVTRTPALEDVLPSCLVTELKPHQVQGLEWLRMAWNAGRPGVLLADDMGLGKTLQTLAFLAALRDSKQKSGKSNGPFLVVAPVGLLSNWKEEHDRHLSGDGLGQLCEAYGAGLARLRLAVDTDGLRRLNLNIIRSSDWVLTTYETLRDNQDDFARIKFAVAIFDETQRVKTPGARVTDAAKGIHAEFTIALTGTPVENRLSDLWCIIDLVQPAYLGDLKTFSAKYENNPTEAALKSLKDELEKSTPHTPRLMMRRMKKDRLEGLEEKTEHSVRVDMPTVQAAAYQEVLSAARHSQSKGDKLKAIHALRLISLHPSPDEQLEDEAFISASARLTACCNILDAIAAKGEKALIFIEFLKFQAKLTGLFQRRYKLTRAPMIISGEVAGPKRQESVRAFQNAASGFDVMILSPRAAGVGLTLTAANHVIHLTRWWNPAVEDQCTDRAHRIGQVRPVTVHLPIAVYPADADRSFDINLDALLARKRKLAADILAAPAPTSDDEDNLFNDIIGAG